MTKRTWLFRVAAIATVAVAAFGNVNVRAQRSTADLFSKVTVSDDVAKRTLMKAVINADAARAIVDACVAWQKTQPGNASIAVFVLSPTGQIIDSHEMDGVLPIVAEGTLLKAKTVLYARSSSAAVAERFRDVDSRLLRRDFGKADGLSYFFVAGGLPIVVDNQLIGAVAVGGGKADEQCAYQALVKVLGPQPPLAADQPPVSAGQGRQTPRQ